MNLENLESFDPRMCISGKMTRINRITANIFRKHLHPYDITNSQTTILFILSKLQGLPQKRLSEIAVLEKSTLNRNLKRLYDKELVSRKDFPVISITNKGKQFVNDIIPAWRNAMDEITNILNPEGEQALNLLHNKLV
ncbi:MAG: MarR family transcriptional regulator [Bacteroidia bacterium]|nr:MarR family transcriptional regulator [Bacteroidia bacterium]